jgi:2-polyprenyl-3-methyl-5-hydroxy-6-metoxy-1,4-benzoquinol methylase
MTTPHASWAFAYDRLYEVSFGSFYERLTELTLAHIQEAIQFNSKIIDFGAGTGRLAIPLAKMGHSVTAVEPCTEMLDVLRTKVGSEKIECVCLKMQDYSSPPRFDFATCVFTVLIYLLDDSDLRASMRSVSQALKPGGQLLLDVPSRAVFRGLSFNSESCNRNVQVTPLAGDIFQYVEVSDIKTTQGVETFTDSFKIRYWKSKDVLKIAQEMGLTIEMDFSDDFSGSGAEYFLLRKG